MYSFKEVAQLSPYDVTVKTSKEVGTGAVGVRDLALPRGTFKGPVTSYGALVTYHTASRTTLETPFGKATEHHFLPGDFLLRPAGCNWSARMGQPSHTTSVVLDDGLIGKLLAHTGTPPREVFGRGEMLPFRSRLLEEITNKLRGQSIAQRDASYADALYFALVQEVWALFCEPGERPKVSRKALDSATYRKLCRIVDDELRLSVSAPELADRLGMTMLDFSAALKERTGQTPYQFVLSRRIAAARDLLEMSTLSISEISYRCGFSSQSHLTDVFRARVGTTPGAYRKSLRA